MILYLSGPMAGKPFFNAAAFAEASTTLRELGHQVLQSSRDRTSEYLEVPNGLEGRIRQVRVRPE